MHRRQLITGIPAVWLATPNIAASKEDRPDIDQITRELAAALAEKHGGNWACKYDHELLMMRKL